MSCLVDGRLSIRSYDDKDGNKRKATEVVVNTMQMLDRANRGGGAGDDGGTFEREPRPAPELARPQTVAAASMTRRSKTRFRSSERK